MGSQQVQWAVHTVEVLSAPLNPTAEPKEEAITLEYV